jgi:hypothetical protein
VARNDVNSTEVVNVLIRLVAITAVVTTARVIVYILPRKLWMQLMIK